MSGEKRALSGAVHDGAWVTRSFDTGHWPLRHRHGAILGVMGVHLPGSARDRYAQAGCSSFIPRPASRRPPLSVEIAIEGIVALAAAAAICDLSDVTLDMTAAFPLSTSASTRSPAPFRVARPASIDEVAKRAPRLGRGVFSGAGDFGRNPFMIIVPCHRVLEAGQLCRQDLAERRRHLEAPAAVDRRRTKTTASKTLFDVLLPVAPPRAHN